MIKIENIIKTILILLLIGCLFKMPYNYFEIVRFLGMVGFIILGYKSYKIKNEIFMVIWFASAILINPLFKIALGRTFWNVIDVIWVITLIFSMFNNKSNDNN